MNLIQLSAFDLGLAAVLVILLAILSLFLQLGMSRQIVIAAIRTTLQLLLIGLILKAIFENVNLLYMTGIALVMLLVAGREVMARQTYRFRGWWGFGMGTMSMFVSTFVVTLLALTVIIGNQPWYTPQYAIPLLGMMLGNTMTGIALGLERLTSTARAQRLVIEARLVFGERARQAMGDIRRESTRAGMLPIVNAMAAAGFKTAYSVTEGFEGDRVKDPASSFYGKRLKNGWKNSGAPWTYELDADLSPTVCVL